MKKIDDADEGEMKWFRKRLRGECFSFGEKWLGFIVGGKIGKRVKDGNPTRGFRVDSHDESQIKRG